MTLTFEAGITLTFSRDDKEEQRTFKAGDILRLASIEEHPDTVLPYYTLRTPDRWIATYVSSVGLFDSVSFNS